MTKKEITYFKELLSKYYLGETSAEEERTLMSMARRADSASLPADLSADIEMLRDMQTMSEEMNDFVQSLDLGLPDEATPKKGKPLAGKVFARVMIGVAAAACIAFAVVFIGIRDSRTGAGVTSSKNIYGVTNVPTSAQETPVEEISEPAVPEPATVAPEPDVRLESLTPNVEPSRKAKPMLASTQEKGTDEFSEVSDVEEATAILEKSLSLLASNVQISGSSLQMTSEILNDTFDETEKTLNKIPL